MQQARAHLTVWLTALAVALAVFFASHLIEPVSRAPFNFGTTFVEMSRDPLGFHGIFPQRVLGPLLASVLGLGGDRYWLFSHATSILLLTVIVAAVRLRGGDLVTAVLLAVAMAGTSVLRVYKNHVGYPDDLTFALLLLSVLAVRRPVLFWSLQLLNLFNHEQILFFWPWLCFLRWREQPRRLRADAIGLLLVAGAYVAFRIWVGHVVAARAPAAAPELQLNTGYYSDHHYFPLGTIGLSALAMCNVVIGFALLPVLPFWHAFVDGWRRVGGGLVLYVLCLLGIFTVAHDVYRFIGFMFLPITLAAARVGSLPHGRTTLFALAVSTPILVWLQLRDGSVFAYIVEVTLSPTECNCFNRMWLITTCVLPRLWYVFVAYALAWLACAWIGRWLARRGRAAAGG